VLTANLNALALVRFGGFRLAHGGHDGFAWVLIGLIAIGVAVWAVSRPGPSEAAKS
jgi:hypothetical protein